MPEATRFVYSTTDPATLATYRQVTAELDAFSNTLQAELIAVGGNGEVYGRKGSVGTADEFTEIGIRDDGHIPDGWQTTGGGARLKPKHAAARRWLAAHQPPDVLHALAERHGLPRQTWDLRGDVILEVEMFERDGELWAVYPIEPAGERDFHGSPCTWTARKTDELPAREATNV